MASPPGPHVQGSGNQSLPPSVADAADAAAVDESSLRQDGADLDNVFVRLNNSLLTLDFVKAALAKSDPFDLIRDSDKAFIDFSKISSLIAAGAINAVNVFGTTLAMSGNHTRISGDTRRQGVVLCFTLLSVPFTLCVAGLAHATEHCTSWINKLAFMMYLEYALLATICGMYGYFLTDASPWIPGVCAPALLAMTYICIFTVFRRPSILQGARPKKVTTASEQLKRELHAPGCPSEQLKTMMRAELKTAEDIQRWLNEGAPAQPPPAARA